MLDDLEKIDNPEIFVEKIFVELVKAHLSLVFKDSASFFASSAALSIASTCYTAVQCKTHEYLALIHGQVKTNQ